MVQHRADGDLVRDRPAAQRRVRAPGPEGVTVCLVGNDERQDVRMLWCPTEADYMDFLCGPGANFARTCAEILNADPLKRGSWK